MFASRLLVCCLTVIAVFSLICVSSAENKAPKPATPDLAQKVAALEKRIAELEKRMEQGIPASKPGPVYQASGTTPPAPANLPPGSVPHTINGTPFYIVPLSQEKTR